MNIAIYTRKSVYSDSSDSTSVQFDLASNYCKSHYSDYQILKYEDEGYSGASTNRPGYESLMSDIRDKLIDIVVCYKIDRISRSVKDFSLFYDEISSLGVEFVSLKENVDTSTPLGRAMMYMCSIFAQMERETIAERITDNMIELAKSGKWSGGRPPIGFKRVKKTIDGKTHTILEPFEGGMRYYNKIVNDFLDGDYSLGGLETYYKSIGFKTLNGKHLSSTQIYNTLKNPAYAPADQHTYDYYKDLGCQMLKPREEFTGEYALSVYGRTQGGKTKKHVLMPPENWKVSIAQWKPVITSEKWLAVQNKFRNNVFTKVRKHKIGLLKGILRCRCGGLMRTKRKIDTKYNKVYDTYICSNHARKGDEFCAFRSAHIKDIDEAFLDIIKDIFVDKSLLKKYMKTETVKPDTSAETKKDIKSVESRIVNLTTALSENKDSSAAKYILQEIETLDRKLEALKHELLSAEKQKADLKRQKENIDFVYDEISHIINNLDSMDYDALNSSFKLLISECVYDGQHLDITI